MIFLRYFVRPLYTKRVNRVIKFQPGVIYLTFRPNTERGLVSRSLIISV